MTGPRAVPAAAGGWRRRGERGSGTVLALAATAVIVVVALGGLALASATSASHRAWAGADLAALAAAGAIQSGASDAEACRRAALVSTGSASLQSACVVRPDGSVSVTTSAQVGLALPGFGRLRARATARAGPAPSL